MSPRTVHVVGAGVAGLAAAVALLDGARGGDDGLRLVLYDAAPHAGGRCRSWHDDALGRAIDNGNHLMLAGNRAVRRYLQRIGSSHLLTGPRATRLPFHDLASGRSWTLEASAGRVPWWILDPRRAVPGARIREYGRVLRLLRAPGGVSVGDTIATTGTLWQRALRPLLLAALNTAPEQASAALAGAVLRASVARGGAAWRPLIAPAGLDATFIAPALDHLRRRGARICLGARLRDIAFDGGAVAALGFGDTAVAVPPHDRVILALPPWAARSLVPGLSAPDRFNAIVNAHYRWDTTGMAPVQGILGGAAQWLFAFPGRLSATVSAAGALADRDADTLARVLWDDIARAAGLRGPVPAARIVKERRATFAATPQQEARRPPSTTEWRNLFLAGDWIATGLPATLEGAALSGERAAALALAW